MRCNICKKTNPHIHYRTEKELKDAGFPTHDKDYKKAHQKANKAEKRVFGERNFQILDKIDRSLNRGTLAGKNTKAGKIEVSKKIPVKFREEVAFHEKVENNELRKKKKK